MGTFTVMPFQYMQLYTVNQDSQLSCIWISNMTCTITFTQAEDIQLFIHINSTNTNLYTLRYTGSGGGEDEVIDLTKISAVLTQ